MPIQIARTINQAVIQFTFGSDTFDIHCHIEGVKHNTPLYNALDAHQFTPLYDLVHDCWQFVPNEFWQAELPMFLQHQAS